MEREGDGPPRCAAQTADHTASADFFQFALFTFHGSAGTADIFLIELREAHQTIDRAEAFDRRTAILALLQMGFERLRFLAAERLFGVGTGEFGDHVAVHRLRGAHSVASLKRRFISRYCGL